MLCNLDEIGWTVGALARRVARIYIDGATPSAAPTPREPPRVALSPEQLASKAGLYRDPVNGTIGRVFVRDGKLMASANPGNDGQLFELVPMSPNRFVIPGTAIVAEFVPPAGGLLRKSASPEQDPSRSSRSG